MNPQFNEVQCVCKKICMARQNANIQLMSNIYFKYLSFCFSKNILYKLKILLLLYYVFRIGQIDKQKFIVIIT